MLERVSLCVVAIALFSTSYGALSDNIINLMHQTYATDKIDFHLTIVNNLMTFATDEYIYTLF